MRKYNPTIIHTPEMSGSGQIGKCVKCGLHPIEDGDEVYDGCLGKLQDSNIMNACCGHGNDKQAYIQYWIGERISGNVALKEQKRLIKTKEG